MRRLFWILLPVLCLFEAAAVQANQAPTRLALIIANSDYNLDGSTQTPEGFSEVNGFVTDLRNPANDGESMRQALERLGFDVTHVEDATREQMGMALALFGAKIDAAPRDAIVIIYYSGHAIQVAGQNYLIPTGARIPRDQDMSRLPTARAASFISTYAISTDVVFEQLRDPGTMGLNLVILDACRNNPWEDRLYGSTRGLRSSRGLAQGAPQLARTLVAYSTAPGALAADGNEDPGANSPYTAALLRWLPVPGHNILQMLNNVGNDVLALTGQIPWVNNAPIGNICLAGCATSSAAAALAWALPPVRAPASINPAQFPPTPPASAPDALQNLALAALARISARDWSIGTSDVLIAELLRGASLPAFSALANAGDARAQWVMGAFHYDGTGVARNLNNAAAWFRRAAAQGNVRGQISLGVLSAEAGDYRTAMTWYRRAASQGSGNAQSRIGYLYDHGFGVAQDHREAMIWYRRAADQGMGIALNNVGLLYARGDGVEQNYATAVMWLRRAVDQGEREAQYNLGVLLASDVPGVTKDLEEARRLITRAAARGVESARRFLIERGIEPPLPAS